jgi:hypothetical protein
MPEVQAESFEVALNHDNRPRKRTIEVSVIGRRD